MKNFIIFLKILSPAFILVGVLHLVFGVAGEVMLGAKLTDAALQEPVLDSQNRFYGIAFSLYGVLFYLSATDISRYHLVLRCVLWVFFLAGCARFVSIYTHGLPSNLVLGLLAAEILLPPIVLLWLNKVRNSAWRMEEKP